MLQHRFYRRQPDLNVTNLAVRNEIAKIIGFWMELGLSGFRVDAVPFLLEMRAFPGAPPPSHSRTTSCATCARSSPAGTATPSCPHRTDLTQP